METISGELKKHHIHYINPNTLEPAEMDFNYYSAVNSVKNSLAKIKDEKGMKRLEKYLEEDVCPDCHGTRLSEAARAPRLRGIGLDEATGSSPAGRRMKSNSQMKALPGIIYKR